jgi:hypothetical protein
MTGGVAQVAACLPSKHETLSSSPRVAKKKKNCLSLNHVKISIFSNKRQAEKTSAI